MLQRPLGKTGLNVSVMSQGGAAIGQQYGPVSIKEVTDCVRSAIDAGVNFIDTSAYYGLGKSEELLGEVLSDGWREKVILCTKAGRLDSNLFDFSANGMRTCLEGSLKRLKVDHVDVLLAHDIEYADNLEQVFTETAEVLHKLKAEGKCRFIGMSGYPLKVLKEAISRCQLDVVISYCHFSLQNRLMLTELLPVAEKHGVGLLNASPLSMGLLTNQGPPPWHPASGKIKAACAEAARHCQSVGADISRLGMQYCFQESRIPSTITGTAKRSELEINLKAIDEPIDTELLQQVLAILEPVQDHTWPSGNQR
jgi:L-galactose dehydrogenase